MDGMEVGLKPAGPSGGNEVDDILAPQFFQMASKGNEVLANPHFGLIDVRLTLEGSETIFGVTHEVLTGENPKEKHSTMCHMRAGEFLKLVEKSGIVFQSKPKVSVILPPGFAIVILNMNDRDVHGLRWEVTGSQQIMKGTVAFLDELVATYPSLATESHAALAKFLQTKMSA